MTLPTAAPPSRTTDAAVYTASFITVAPASGTLDIGDTLTITLGDHGGLAVQGGRPDLTLSNGAVANFASVDGSGNLVFTCTVTPGHASSDLHVTGLVLNGATIGATGTLATAAGTTYAVGASPGIMIATDLNGDGIADLVIANEEDDDVSVLLGLGSGSFASGSAFYAGINPAVVVAGDVNGDGHEDLLVADNDTSDTVSLLLGDGSGGFAAATSFVVGALPFGLALADVNHDGKLDMIVSNKGDGTVSVLPGDGSGGFGAQTTFAVVGSPSYLVVADLNADGNPDIITSDETGDTISVLLGNGSGGFAAPVTYDVGQAPEGIAVGDVNGDGKLDLVVAAVTGNAVTVLFGNGSGGFSSQTSYPAGPDPFVVALADLDGDGKTDILVTQFAGSDVGVLLGDGSGGFADDSTIAAGSTPVGLVTADLDGDGKPDVAVTNYTSGTVTVLRNESTPTTSLNTAGVASLSGSDTHIRVLSAYPATGLTVTPASGTLDIGDTLAITVVHTGTLEVSGGTPTLTLSNGAVANFASLDGDGNLVFDYTVASDQATADLHVTGLDLNGATIGVTGSVSTAAETYFAVGALPTTVIAADLNSDGHPDLIVADTVDNRVSVLLGLGSDRFADQEVFLAGNSPSGLATADLNGDGHPDLVVADADSSDTVMLLLGDGYGGFLDPITYTAGSLPSDVALADVNHDGKLDMIVSSPGDDTVSVLPGDGSGGFGAETTFAVVGSPDHLAVADLNGDGSPDIITSDSTGHTISVLLGNGSGGFAAPVTYAVGSQPEQIATGDLNGDGKIDLAVVNEESDTVSVLFGNGSGGFSSQTSYAIGASPFGVALADFNGDGTQDIVVSELGGGSVGVLLGDGSGSFAAETVFSAGESPYGVLVTDLDGDGKPDIAVTNYTSDDVTLLPNSSVTATSLDASGIAALPGSDTGVAIACFATGTRIRTQEGELAVEALRVGDRVVSAFGGLARIRWIGHRRTDCAAHPRPHDVNPVRIRAGAFAPGLPARDLRMSPDHALHVDGVLVPVRYLVNGATILQESVAEITYWHVELAAHDVIHAEGLPVESYLDTGNRGAFSNGGAPVHLHADFALRVWRTRSCAPLVTSGATLTAIRARLLARAGALGHCAVSDDRITLEAGGRVIRPLIRGGELLFVVPHAAGMALLCSAYHVPAHFDAAGTDHRRLGVAVSRLAIDRTEMALDDGRLGAGWHAPEPGLRWTDGVAAIDLRGIRQFALRVVMTPRTWRGPALRRAG